VAEALAAESASTKPLSGAAAYHLRRLVAEFADELTPPPSTASYRSFGHIVRIPVDSQRSVQMDFFNRVRVDTGNPNASVGAILNTSGDDHFAAYNRMEFFVFRNLLVNENDSAWTEHVPGYRDDRGRDNVLFDIPEGYLQFKIPWMNLEVGRDYAYWGPGYTSSVMLSDNAPSLDQVRLTAQFSQVKLTAFTAALSPYRDWQRFVSGQRIEVNFWNHVVAGAGLFVVSCPDSAETKDFFSLINPLIPLYPEIVNAGDPGNLLAGGDIAAYLPHVKLYGQLNIDNYEFRSESLKKIEPYRPPDAYGLQGGLLATPLPCLGVRYEYTKVTAYTYYHLIRQIAYTNYDVPLGASIGPDADNHFAEIDWYGSRWGYVSLVGQITRRGDHNRGDWTNRTFTDAPEVSQFPTGTVEHTYSLGPQVVIDPFAWLKLTAGTAWYRITNVAGNEGQTRQGLSFSLDLEHRYR
jgi:hypothetical protein